MALMKLSTYHKNRGDEVQFYKGDVKKLVRQQLTLSAINAFKNIYPDEPIQNIPVKYISSYLEKGNLGALDELKTRFNDALFIDNLVSLRRSYKNGAMYNSEDWKWDRVYVTTLFTFYWDITIKTLRDAKLLVRSNGRLYTGGVAATILTDKLIEEAGIPRESITVGLLDKPGQLDADDTQVIDSLPLDYSILDEIEYKYPESGNYYAYTTRGCVNHCPFCVVPIIEPEYKNYITLTSRLEHIRKEYGEQKNLLLLDNNIMASSSYEQILNEIRDNGFGKNDRFEQPDYLSIIIDHLRNGKKDRGRLIKAIRMIVNFYDNQLDENKQQDYYKILKENLMFCDTRYILASVSQIVQVYDAIKDDYKKCRKPSKSLRFVDFNQGVDARLITDEKMRLMSQIAIKPLRIAFDSWSLEPIYTKAIRCAAKYGIKYLSNYMLYNFKDKPEDLYKRMRTNVELGEELKLQIFSFPMKYHPVKEEPYFRNRKYIGQHWNRKYIRAIQCVLNATKGKVGPKLDFFKAAFGETLEEYQKILLMPEEYIIMRQANRDKTIVWWKQWCALSDEEKEIAKKIIFKNIFKENEWEVFPNPVKIVLAHYL